MLKSNLPFVLFEELRLVAQKKHHKETFSGSHPLNKEKDESLNFIRGIAVFLMIFTHVTGFFYDFSQHSVSIANRIGAIVCFTTFLFVYGYLIGKTGLFSPQAMQNEKNAPDFSTFSKKTLKRTLPLILGYYGIGIVFLLKSFSFKLLLEIVFFIKLVDYAEFIVAFIIFNLIVGFFAKYLYKIARNGFFVIIFSAFLYSLGILLNNSGVLHQIPIIREYLGLFVGSRGLHYFPILMYMPVLLLGLWFSNFYKEKKFSNLKYSAIFFFLSLFLTVFIFSLGGLIIGDINHLEKIFIFSMERWPPAPGFLLLGLDFIFFTALIFSLYQKLSISKSKILKFFEELINISGRNVFNFFIFHTIILYIISFFFREPTNSLYIIFLLYIFVIFACYVYVLLPSYIGSILEKRKKLSR